jgi:hypothetical protein
MVGKQEQFEQRILERELAGIILRVRRDRQFGQVISVGLKSRVT